jgi:hypothetical protein
MGRRGVISSFKKWFLPAFATLQGGGWGVGGRHPVAATRSRCSLKGSTWAWAIGDDYTNKKVSKLSNWLKSFVTSATEKQAFSCFNKNVTLKWVGSVAGSQLRQLGCRWTGWNPWVSIRATSSTYQHRILFKRKHCTEAVKNISAAAKKCDEQSKDSFSSRCCEGGKASKS